MVRLLGPASWEPEQGQISRDQKPFGAQNHHEFGFTWWALLQRVLIENMRLR